MRDSKRQGQDLAIAAACFAAIALLVVAGMAKQALSQTQPQTTIKEFNTEPFRDWVDRSEIVTPELVEVQVKNCAGGNACVDPQTGVMTFPRSYVNSPGFWDARSIFYHELGHVFQLENNDEVQSGYPPLDSRCGGTYTEACADYFADRYKNCAKGGTQSPATCAFIEEVAGP